MTTPQSGDDDVLEHTIPHGAPRLTSAILCERHEGFGETSLTLHGVANWMIAAPTLRRWLILQFVRGEWVHPVKVGAMVISPRGMIVMERKSVELQLDLSLSPFAAIEIDADLDGDPKPGPPQNYEVRVYRDESWIASLPLTVLAKGTPIRAPRLSN